MARAIPAISGSAAALLPRPFAGLGHALAEQFRRLTHELLHPYRPELYYMRGPGPAWHAKHDRRA